MQSGVTFAMPIGQVFTFNPWFRSTRILTLLGFRIPYLVIASCCSDQQHF